MAAAPPWVTATTRATSPLYLGKRFRRTQAPGCKAPAFWEADFTAKTVVKSPTGT